MQNLPYFSKIVSIWGSRCYKRSKIDFEHSCLFWISGNRIWMFWAHSQWFWLTLSSCWGEFSIPVIVATQIAWFTRHRVKNPNSSEAQECQKSDFGCLDSRWFLFILDHSRDAFWLDNSQTQHQSWIWTLQRPMRNSPNQKTQLRANQRIQNVLQFRSLCLKYQSQLSPI